MSHPAAGVVFAVTRIVTNGHGGAFMKNEGTMSEEVFELVKDKMTPASDGADLFEKIREAVTSEA